MFLKTFGLDAPFAVAYAPRVLMAVCAGCMDVGMYILADRLCGPTVARFAVLFHLVSWFNGYMLVRTYSTSLEAMLNLAAALVWTYDRRLAMVVAALSVSIRPLGAAFWVAFGLSSVTDLSFVLPTLFVTIPIAILGNLALDSWAYGRWTFVPYNFLKFNLLDGHSALYGTHHKAWYLTEGFPVTLMTFMPLTAYEVYRMAKTSRAQMSTRDRTVWLFTVAAIVYTLVLSLGAHKEHRFLFAYHWVFLLLAAKCFTRLASLVRARGMVVVALILIVQILAGFFLCVFHQQAGDKITAILRTHDRSVFFLTPCHQFALHSHRHGNTTMGFLDCSPPLDALSANQPTWVQRFFKAPTETAQILFEEGNLPTAEGLCLPQRVSGAPYPYGTLPEVLVLSQSITKDASFYRWLRSSGYAQKHVIFHAYFAEGPYELETPSYYEIWEQPE